MSRRAVLVLTHPFDPTADHVVEELNRRRRRVFRCDPGEFPHRLTVVARLAADDAGTTGWVGRLQLPERAVDLTEIGCVYYRRPTAFDLPDSLTGQARRWAELEARLGVGGVLSSLPRWLNHPASIGRAEYKPVQLVQAQECGLTVPATLVTNDPKEAAAFVTAVGPAVYKPFGSTGILSGGTYGAVFTTPVTAADIDDSVRMTAHLFQAWIDKQYEVRLTAVDDQLFAARIDARNSVAALDWRADYDALAYSPLPDVPPVVRRGVEALMSTLQLRFGTLDFIVDPDDRWWFLEINPNGQWAWIEEATGLPIAAAIADALTREGR